MSKKDPDFLCNNTPGSSFGAAAPGMDDADKPASVQAMGSGVHAIADDTKQPPKQSREKDPRQSEEQSKRMDVIDPQNLPGVLMLIPSAFWPYPFHGDLPEHAKKNALEQLEQLERYERQFEEDAIADQGIGDLRGIGCVKQGNRRPACTKIPDSVMRGRADSDGTYCCAMAHMLRTNNFLGAWQLWMGLAPHDKILICRIKDTEVGGGQNPHNATSISELSVFCFPGGGCRGRHLTGLQPPGLVPRSLSLNENK